MRKAISDKRAALLCKISTRLFSKIDVAIFNMAGEGYREKKKKEDEEEEKKKRVLVILYTIRKQMVRKDLLDH